LALVGASFKGSKDPWAINMGPMMMMMMMHNSIDSYCRGVGIGISWNYLTLIGASFKGSKDPWVINMGPMIIMRIIMMVIIIMRMMMFNLIDYYCMDIFIITSK
jgi:hypothetical protein